MDSSTARDGRPPAWWIYALGGGLGHLTRALALGRRAAQRGTQVRILSNSVFASRLAQDAGPLGEPRMEVVPLPGAGPKTDVVRAVHGELSRSPAPDVLVVDTFPRGLAGELAEVLPGIPSLKVLVHRRLNPDYVRWADLETFVSRYELLLVPGEDAPLAHLAQARWTDPWLISTAADMCAPDVARQTFGLAPENSLPLVLVLGSGKPAEAQAAAAAAGILAGRLAGTANVRFTSCDDAALAQAGELGCSRWPVLPLLGGVDLLVGAGGYNTVQEARATSTPLIAVPQPRLYDQQSSRLLPQETADDWEAAVGMAVEWLRHPRAIRRDVWSFPDGADEAVRIIQGLSVH